MKVLSVPGRLRFVSACLLLAVPLAAIETVVVARAPWWRLPFAAIGTWSMTVALVCFPLSFGITRGKRWALNLTKIFAVTWCILSAWVAIRMRHPGVGFLTLFLMMFWLGLIHWLEFEMSRSFFDPQLAWYQSLPKPIPGLKCLLFDREFRVSRLDTEGAFLFSDLAQSKLDLQKTNSIQLVFHYKNKEIHCQGMAVRLLGSIRGAGIQFRGMSLDAKKDLGDFVQILRGEGHV